MNLSRSSGPTHTHLGAIKRYYRFHARIYDLSRWTFLKGRKALRATVAESLTPHRILEVGCGTGTNLLHLARLFPVAHLAGIDISADMLAVAKKKLRNFSHRLTLVQAAYDRPMAPGPQFDQIVFSYALSMFNPGWEEALAAAILDLKGEGTIAVVDFHDSPSPAFKKWLGLNHVRLDGHLLPFLRSQFLPCRWDIRPVYGGLWSYFFFIGHKSG